MEYTIKQVSQLANISTRTLRYYDEIGLLHPSYLNESGYRIYTSEKLDLLQQILFYKELDFSLDKIRTIIHSDTFTVIQALQENYDLLSKKKTRIEKLLHTITETITHKESNRIMKDDQKFKGFKEKLIQDNEEKYGDEIRSHYGNETIDASYMKVRKMSSYQFNYANELAQKIKNELKAAMPYGIESKQAINVCKLHQEWIQLYWEKYTKEAHIGLVQMYLEDDRFKAYYEKVEKGATKFLKDAMILYLKK